MTHRADCKCLTCELLMKRRPWSVVAKVMSGVHMKIAEDKRFNPAYLVTRRILDAWDSIPLRYKNEAAGAGEKLHEVLQACVGLLKNDNQDMPALNVLGTKEANAQVSDFRQPSPYDAGDRKHPHNLFYCTVYVGGSRVTVSIA